MQGSFHFSDKSGNIKNFFEQGKKAKYYNYKNNYRNDVRGNEEKIDLRVRSKPDNRYNNDCSSASNYNKFMNNTNTNANNRYQNRNHETFEEGYVYEQQMNEKQCRELEIAIEKEKMRHEEEDNKPKQLSPNISCFQPNNEIDAFFVNKFVDDGNDEPIKSRFFDFDFSFNDSIVNIDQSSSNTGKLDKAHNDNCINNNIHDKKLPSLFENSNSAFVKEKPHLSKDIILDENLSFIIDNNETHVSQREKNTTKKNNIVNSLQVENRMGFNDKLSSSNYGINCTDSNVFGAITGVNSDKSTCKWDNLNNKTQLNDCSSTQSMSKDFHFADQITNVDNNSSGNSGVRSNSSSLEHGITRVASETNSEIICNATQVISENTVSDNNKNSSQTATNANTPKNLTTCENPLLKIDNSQAKNILYTITQQKSDLSNGYLNCSQKQQQNLQEHQQLSQLQQQYLRQFSTQQNQFQRHHFSREQQLLHSQQQQFPLCNSEPYIENNVQEQQRPQHVSSQTLYPQKQGLLQKQQQNQPLQIHQIFNDISHNNNNNKTHEVVVPQCFQFISQNNIPNQQQMLQKFDCKQQQSNIIADLKLPPVFQQPQIQQQITQQKLLQQLHPQSQTLQQIQLMQTQKITPQLQLQSNLQNIQSQQMQPQQQILLHQIQQQQMQLQPQVYSQQQIQPQQMTQLQQQMHPQQLIQLQQHMQPQQLIQLQQHMLPQQLLQLQQQIQPSLRIQPQGPAYQTLIPNTNTVVPLSQQYLQYVIAPQESNYLPASAFVGIKNKINVDSTIDNSSHPFQPQQLQQCTFYNNCNLQVTANPEQQQQFIQEQLLKSQFFQSQQQISNVQPNGVIVQLPDYHMYNNSTNCYNSNIAII